MVTEGKEGWGWGGGWMVGPKPPDSTTPELFACYWTMPAHIIELLASNSSKTPIDHSQPFRYSFHWWIIFSGVLDEYHWCLNWIAMPKLFDICTNRMYPRSKAYIFINCWLGINIIRNINLTSHREWIVIVLVVLVSKTWQDHSKLLLC